MRLILKILRGEKLLEKQSIILQLNFVIYQLNFFYKILLQFIRHRGVFHSGEFKLALNLIKLRWSLKMVNFVQ